MADNRRTHFRYGMNGKESDALLRTSEGEFSVFVTDQSAGGYGLRCQRKLVVTEDELVTLGTLAGQSICRVIHLAYDGDDTLMGLKLVSEIVAGEADGDKHDWFASLTTPSRLLVFTFYFLCVSAGFAWYLEVPVFGATKKANAPIVARDPEERTKALARGLRTLDDLKSRQVVRMLNLTDGQQRKVDKVLEKLMSDLSRIDQARDKQAPETWSLMAMMITRRSWNEVEAHLTDEQVVKWNGYLDEQAKLLERGDEKSAK